MQPEKKSKLSRYIFFSVWTLIIGLSLSSALLKAGVYFYTHIKGDTIITDQKASLPNPLLTKQKITTAPKSDLNVSAWAYLAQNLETGEVYAAKNKRLILPIASITKLVTAAVAEDNLPPTTVVTVTQAMLNTTGNGANLKLGEKITSNDLIYPLLMVSSNDASEALARTYGRADFINLMNAKAKKWGATNTNFIDPSGLSYENTSTAEDVYIFLKEYYNNRKNLLDITRLKTKTIRGHTWVNSKHFLNMSSYVGGKNGYTDEAEKTNASIFTIEDKDGNTHPVAIIVLRSLNRDKDTLSILNYVEGLYAR